MSRKAFTLIELLVVIAIIAILAAILFPVFAQAKAAAKKTAQLNNQKQTNTAYQMYLADYDDTVPLTFWGGTNVLGQVPGCMMPGAAPGLPDRACLGAQTPGWPKLLEPYTKNWQILRDSVVGDPNGIYSNPSFNWWANWSRFSSIGYNWAYFCPTPGDATASDGRQAPISATSMSEPANTIAFVDSRRYDSANAKWVSGYIVTDPPTCTTCTGYWFGGWPSVSPDPRHSEGFNVSWADGHAKYNKLTQINSDKYWDLISN